MTPPKISVIMPAFNAYDTLTTAAASVIGQSFQDWEMIIIDDGSTDNTLALALSIASEDERIRVISQVNGGVSEARNFGVEMTRAPLLAFLDADDAWRPNKLAVHHQLHRQQPGLDASFARTAFREDISSDYEGIRTFSTVPSDQVALSAVIADNPVCTTSNLVVSRSAWNKTGPFQKGMNYAEDQEWLARLICGGGSLLGIDETLTDYRMSEDGLSADLDKMLLGWRSLATRYADHIDLREAEAIYYRYLARRALRTGGPASQAIIYAARGLYNSPSGFMSDPRRGGMTIAGAVAGLVMPAPLRSRVFA